MVRRPEWTPVSEKAWQDRRPSQAMSRLLGYRDDALESSVRLHIRARTEWIRSDLVRIADVAGSSLLSAGVVGGGSGIAPALVHATPIWPGDVRPTADIVLPRKVGTLIGSDSGVIVSEGLVLNLR